MLKTPKISQYVLFLFCFVFFLLLGNIVLFCLHRFPSINELAYQGEKMGVTVNYLNTDTPVRRTLIIGWFWPNSTCLPETKLCI